jgi:hypothetical protein
MRSLPDAGTPNVITYETRKYASETKKSAAPSHTKRRAEAGGAGA